MTKLDLITPIHFTNTSLWLEKGNFSNCLKQDSVGSFLVHAGKRKQQLYTKEKRLLQGFGC